MKVRFKPVYGRVDLHGKWSCTDLEEIDTFISGPFKYSGDLFDAFEYFLFLTVYDMESLDSSYKGGKWNVSLSAAAPSLVHSKALKSALRCAGIPNDQYAAMPEEEKAYALREHGTHMIITDRSGGNLRKLVTEAILQARDAVATSFEEFLDKPQNAICTSGLDMMSGDLLAPLGINSYNESEEAALMKKLYANSGTTLLGGDPNPLYRGEDETYLTT